VLASITAKNWKISLEQSYYPYALDDGNHYTKFKHIQFITAIDVALHCWLGIRKSILPVKSLSDEVLVW